MSAPRFTALIALSLITCLIAETRSSAQPKAKPKPGAPLVADLNDLPKVGSPFSGWATVQRPSPLKNVRSWSIETKRHRWSLQYLTVSPDGARVATSGYDGVVRIWDTTSGTFERAFLGHEGTVTGLAFSPDGKYLASAGYYSARVWDMATGLPVRVLKGKYGVSLVAWSPDGTKLLTGGGGSGQIALWDVAANKQLVDTEYGNPIGSIAFSPDGENVAVAAGRAGTYIADSVKLKTVHVFKEMLDTDYAVGFSPDGKQLAVGSAKQTIVYNVSSGMVNKKLMTPGHSLVWTPKAGLLITNATSQVVPHSPDELSPGKPLPGNGAFLSLSADGSTLFGLYGTNVSHWNLDNSMLVRTFSVGEYSTLTCGPSTSVLVPGAKPALWDASTGKRIDELADHKGGIVASAWSSNGKQLAIAAYDKKVRVYDPATGKLLRTLTAPANIVALSVSLDGKVAASTGDKKVSLWLAAGEMPAHTLVGFSTIVRTMSWTREGRLLATGDDKQIAIWGDNGKQIRTVEHPRPIHSVLWSTDSARLFVGSSEEYALAHYQALTWKLQPSFEKGTNALACVTAGWSPDGSILLGHRQSAIQQWNGKSGKQGTVVGSPGGAYSMAFWPDGKTIAAGGVDRAVRFWDAASGRLRFMMVSDSEQVASINADGHYRIPESIEKEFFAVVMTDKLQETLSLKDFAAKYAFRNLPANVK